jgi:hypothetical protein
MMNPLLVIGLLAGAALLLGKKSTQAQPNAVVKLPTAKTTGSVNVTLPSTSSKPGQTLPTVITLPETTITAGAANDSLLLTADEMAWLQNGTPDEIYQHATESSHPAFVAAAGLALAGKGDLRALEVSQLATQF